MPTYDYQCRKCKRRFELFHSIMDDTPKRCPRCKGRADRKPSSGAGLLFKGSGFYITDYRSKAYRDKAKQEKPADTSSAGESSDKKTTTPKPPTEPKRAKKAKEE
jgi:putative FmdB family regulatory protein